MAGPRGFDRGGFPRYVPAAERASRASREVRALEAKGRVLAPVVIEGRSITATFWGKSWCEHLETYSDYATRLPRGRAYARGGAIVDLVIERGRVRALVSGTRLYTVELAIDPLAPARWSAVARSCAGAIGSLVELLSGKVSSQVMAIMTDRQRGLFPAPREIRLSCSCPDWATMCKHVAATMYGIGARLDDAPELLFLLRGVDPAALVASSVGRAATLAGRPRDRRLPEASLAGIFGIELDLGRDADPEPSPRRRRKRP